MVWDKNKVTLEVIIVVAEKLFKAKIAIVASDSDMKCINRHINREQGETKEACHLNLLTEKEIWLQELSSL